MDYNEFRSALMPEGPFTRIKETLTGVAGDVLGGITGGVSTGLYTVGRTFSREHFHFPGRRVRNFLILTLFLAGIAAGSTFLALNADREITDIRVNGFSSTQVPRQFTDPNRPPVFATTVPPTREPLFHIHWP